MTRILLCALVFSLFAFVSYASGGSAGAGPVPPSNHYVVNGSMAKFESLYQEGKGMGYFFYEELTSKLLPKFKGIPYGSGGACASGGICVAIVGCDLCNETARLWVDVACLYTSVPFEITLCCRWASGR